MKTPVLIFVAIAVIGIVGIGAYVMFQKATQPDSMMKNDDTSAIPTEAMMKKDDSTMEGEEMMEDNTENKMDDKIGDKMVDSRYVQYSASAFEGASGNRRVLFFYASWCPSCVPADANFTQNSDRIPEDVTVIRVNYNDPETDQEEKDLARQYGITYQHTFVQIDSDGAEVTKWNGGQVDALLSNIQ